MVIIWLNFGKLPDLSIIGIEPDAVEFNSGLSGAVEKSIPIILQMVEEEANQYAAKDTHYR